MKGSHGKRDKPLQNRKRYSEEDEEILQNRTDRKREKNTPDLNISGYFANFL